MASIEEEEEERHHHHHQQQQQRQQQQQQHLQHERPCTINEMNVEIINCNLFLEEEGFLSFPASTLFHVKLTLQWGLHAFIEPNSNHGHPGLSTPSSSSSSSSTVELIWRVTYVPNPMDDDIPTDFWACQPYSLGRIELLRLEYGLLEHHTRHEVQTSPFQGDRHDITHASTLSDVVIPDIEFSQIPESCLRAALHGVIRIQCTKADDDVTLFVIGIRTCVVRGKIISKGSKLEFRPVSETRASKLDFPWVLSLNVGQSYLKYAKSIQTQ